MRQGALTPRPLQKNTKERKMEIITRPTQKRFRQSGKKAPFRVLAVVLALVLTASMFAIGIPIVAAGVSYLGAIIGKRLKGGKGRRR